MFDLCDLLRCWKPKYDKLRESDGYAGNKYALLPEGRNFTAEVDSVGPNSRERLRP